MTPSDVYAMDDDEYTAFVDYMREEDRANQRAMRKARR
jgi:hypothetical protein